ncbi:MAG: competence/damage-inducible protein A [Clostridiales bacterium]|nr:competence/damage-inducible protein A [Clostridiales bacterium]
MIAETICVGEELLCGQTQNTHAGYIAAHLAELGIVQRHQDVVGDDAGQLAECLRAALTRADLVILCGGLGPTYDDITKEIACEVMGLPLRLYPEIWERIQGIFAAGGKLAPPENIKQAMFPDSCIVLPNKHGTAPGCILEVGGKIAICLPGPPRELEPMFEASVLPYLRERSGGYFHTRVLHVFGMGESDVAHRLTDLFARQNGVRVAPYVKTGEVTLRVTANCKDATEGEALLAPVIAEIRSILGDIVYSDCDMGLPEVCHALLLERGLTLATAESCTGGLLCSAFVDMPGSSAYMLGGTIPYSNAAKVCMLGVSEDTIREHGAVSAQCAQEMAEGMRARSGADLALATTGIAGPGGGTATKPVGLVYIALASENNTQVKELRLRYDRAKNRELSVLHALDMLRRAMH